VFGGWHALSELLVEKSPHRLHPGAAPEVVAECMPANPDVAFIAVGPI
jgi:hypothetical protein